MTRSPKFKKKFILLLVLLFFFESSCAHVARLKQPPPPTERPAHLVHYYRYPPLTVTPLIHTLRSHKRYTEKRVIFRQVEDLPGHRSSLVIHYYEPKEKRRHPLIVITPVLGKNYGIERSFANYFANRGYACAIVHRQRLRLVPDQELSKVEEYLRSSVIRVRLALDWLERQERIDPERIGTYGISFGGILNTILGGIEPRVKCHLIALAGGNLADVICYSHEGAIQRYRQQFMKRKGLTLEELHEELRKAIISEPMEFAHFIDSRKVYLFIAWFDFVVGRKHARKLAKALGYPETYYVPLGHYSSALAIPFIRVKTLQFFDSHLKPPPPPSRK
ncbi:MAG: hypothetical protein HY590_00825 [Candidatus Omnitrophica bacterium]|nr:hypothetical protein [Candidatus Omnitrophota bacterium]